MQSKDSVKFAIFRRGRGSGGILRRLKIEDKKTSMVNADSKTIIKQFFLKDEG